jgi:hypothetical protein
MSVPMRNPAMIGQPSRAMMGTPGSASIGRSGMARPAPGVPVISLACFRAVSWLGREQDAG